MEHVSSREHIRFIINPNSGKKRKKRIPDIIERKLNHDLFSYDIIYTEYKEHAKELVKEAIQEKVDIICAVGGDGSVHEIGTSLIDTNIKLAIIPKGSGNGLARHMKIPRQTLFAVKCINENNYQLIDTVSVNTTAYLGVAGVGIDALIAEKFDSTEKRGLKGYVKIVMKEYFKYKSINVRFQLDDQEEKNESVFICSIANGSQFGNGFVISPESIIDDGYLEFFRLRKINFFEIPFIALRFFNGTIHKSRFAKLTKFKEGVISIDQNVIHMDGEPKKVEFPLYIKVKPKSLLVLSNRKNKS